MLHCSSDFGVMTLLVYHIAELHSVADPALTSFKKSVNKTPMEIEYFLLENTIAIISIAIIYGY